MTKIREDLEWVRVYWVRGGAPKHAEPSFVKDPPCSGWSAAFLMRGAKRSVLFCPYTLQGYQVPNRCYEMTGHREVDFNEERIIALMQSNWTEHQSRGNMSDYDTAAVVFKRLGLKEPEQLLKGGEEDSRTKGGKPAAASLLKPIKKAGKRGVFLSYLMEAEQPVSVRELMAEFDMTRSNVLSYLHVLNRDQGIGYSLIGDGITMEVPEGEIWVQ